GIYEITGVAYSGTGRITKVMVSADGGASWAQAALQEPVLPKAFTRFRMPWRWDGGPAILQSRAWDEGGNVQPTRAQFVAARGDISILPDGTGLPPGQGTAAEGAPIYKQKCAPCHGENGEGGIAGQLIGGPPRATLDGGKTIANFYPYATTIFDYVRRAMPYS